MERRLQDILNQLKEPTLKYDVVSGKDLSPKIGSYLGGKPYMEKDEKTSTCLKCKKVLSFVFQFFIPTKNTLYAFYYCFHCSIGKGSKHGFDVKVYKNPHVDKLKTGIRKKGSINYHEFEFLPAWSLPDWDALEVLNPEIFNIISTQFKDEAWAEYETIKESIVGVMNFEPFSFYKGYPQFLAEPHFPTCTCCQEKMELFTQIDSFDEEGVSWGDTGCLYLFQCANGNERFNFFIQ